MFLLVIYFYYFVLSIVSNPIELQGTVRVFSNSTNLTQIPPVLVNGKYRLNDLLVMFIGTSDSSRINVVEQEWGNEFMDQTNNRMFVISNNGCPKSRVQCITYSAHYQEIVGKRYGYSWSNTDRAAKRAYAAEYMIEKTDAKWLLVLTDDVWANVKRLVWFMEHIHEEKGDPYNNVLLEGHCIDRNAEYNFIQGGSGFIMSRKAAEKFMTFGPKWVSETSLPDDVHFSSAVQRLGLSIKQCTSGHFIGHGLIHYQADAITSRKWDTLPNCPGSVNNVYCASGIYKLQDLMVFHYIPTSWKNFHIGKVISEGIPDNIFWYQTGDTPNMCKVTKQSE